MSLSVITTPTENLETLAAKFFKHSVGAWTSQRRYYTLKNGEAQEVVSALKIEFLEANHPDLVALAAMHHLDLAMICGVKSSWESNYISPSRKQATGSTIFGIQGNMLYRDRGFATAKPVVATYQMRDRNTMQLHTEYSGSSFDEELKLIGNSHRTRQTIISRAGQEIMIGQYLETRV
ncbi:phycobiliprotein lyase [Leptothoe spongobia]|uniref:Chromophore lyase CpcS/CpeS n=1 Tax=Leptothoe spongobia TAU-MAC 1115 TaxID=1967444 RepID=A0A947GPY8_9CYAN|nr:phycobiliprotein lyase [Leptothoe spongobia]MBT9316796.1 phycobiliprotein lyase [Leptothoe spongobia TAU-MAC 1115]